MKFSLNCQLENDVKRDLYDGLNNTCNDVNCKLNVNATCEEDKEFSNVVKRDIKDLDAKSKFKKQEKTPKVQFKLTAQIKETTNTSQKAKSMQTALVKNNQKYKIRLNKLTLTCPNGFVQKKSKCGKYMNHKSVD